MQKNTKNAKNAKKKWKKPKFLLLSLSSSLLSSSSTSSTSSSSSRSFSMQNLVSWKLTELWPIWFRSKKGRYTQTHRFHRYIVVRWQWWWRLRKKYKEDVYDNGGYKDDKTELLLFLKKCWKYDGLDFVQNE